MKNIKDMDPQMKKKLKIIIASSCVVLIVVVFLILHSIFRKGEGTTTKVDEKTKLTGVYIIPGIAEDSSLNTTTNTNLTKENCINNICISEVTIKSYSDSGLISYKLTNKGAETQSGHLKLELSTGYSTIIVYQNLASGRSVEGYHGFDGFSSMNLASSYTISATNEYDEKNIVDK